MNQQKITIDRVCEQTTHLLKQLDFRMKASFRNSQYVIPFYVLHQMVMVASGYFIVQWNLPVLLKLFLLLVICFGSLFLLYQVLIKRMMLPKILFSLKTKEKRRTGSSTV